MPLRSNWPSAESLSVMFTVTVDCWDREMLAGEPPDIDIATLKFSPTSTSLSSCVVIVAEYSALYRVAPLTLAAEKSVAAIGNKVWLRLP